MHCSTETTTGFDMPIFFVLSLMNSNLLNKNTSVVRYSLCATGEKRKQRFK